MPVTMGEVHCGACGILLDESPHAVPEQRVPCLRCGSLSRSFGVFAEDRAKAQERIELVGRHAGLRKFFVKQVSGVDLHRKSGIWMHLTRVIDRANDWYHERVVNPKTGEVVRECSEPLSEHRGHGADRGPK
jgi:hypothetical protein